MAKKKSTKKRTRKTKKASDVVATKNRKRKNKTMSKEELALWLRKNGHPECSTLQTRDELENMYMAQLQAYEDEKHNKEKANKDIVDAKDVEKISVVAINEVIKGKRVRYYPKPKNWMSIPEDEIASTNIRDGKRIFVLHQGPKFVYDE